MSGTHRLLRGDGHQLHERGGVHLAHVAVEREHGLARRAGKEGGAEQIAVKEDSNGREPVSVARHKAPRQPGWHPAGIETQTIVTGITVQVKGQGVL